MKAKKSYGQHFLSDESIARKIVDKAIMYAGDLPLLEIGPGKGVLTKYLIEEQKDFKAIEADADMYEYLLSHFEGIEKQLFLEDFLKTKLERIYPGKEFAIFGNFPYNISSQILIKMLKNRDRVPVLLGMFQKELAERVIAAHGSKTYGKISVLVQAYYSGKVLFHIKPGSFSPPPKVDSAVIVLERKRIKLEECDEKIFKQVVGLAFSQRRKMLRNTLKGLVNDNELLQQDVFTKRPEHLSVDEFIDLTNLITKHITNES